jgi:hypothetical protein
MVGGTPLGSLVVVSLVHGTHLAPDSAECEC